MGGGSRAPSFLCRVLFLTQTLSTQKPLRGGLMATGEVSLSCVCAVWYCPRWAEGLCVARVHLASFSSSCARVCPSGHPRIMVAIRFLQVPPSWCCCLGGFGDSLCPQLPAWILAPSQHWTLLWWAQLQRGTKEKQGTGRPVGRGCLTVSKSAGLQSAYLEPEGVRGKTLRHSLRAGGRRHTRRLAPSILQCSAFFTVQFSPPYM